MVFWLTKIKKILIIYLYRSKGGTKNRRVRHIRLFYSTRFCSTPDQLGRRAESEMDRRVLWASIFERIDVGP